MGVVGYATSTFNLVYFMHRKGQDVPPLTLLEGDSHRGMIENDKGSLVYKIKVDGIKNLWIKLESEHGAFEAYVMEGEIP
jgi:hypothetical protein